MILGITLNVGVLVEVVSDERLSGVWGRGGHTRAFNISGRGGSDYLESLLTVRQTKRKGAYRHPKWTPSLFMYWRGVFFHLESGSPLTWLINL